MRSRLILIVAALGALCTVGIAQLREDPATRGAESVLRAFLGLSETELTISAVQPAEGGCVRLRGAVLPAEAAEDTGLRGDFRAVVDPAQGMVCLLYVTGFAIAEVDTSSAEAIARGAEEYARAHFVQWGPATTLERHVHKDSGTHILFWENRLPSGAKTGAWCSVMVSERHGGIVGFVQRKALRTVAEAEILVSRDVAERAAVEALQTGLPAGVEIKVLEANLMLSHHRAPEHGPVWTVRAAACPTEGGDAEALSVCVVMVDAITGRVLEVAR